MKPNFFIIGQTKSGTSSMHNYLEQHPQVFVPAKKELRYFSYDLADPQRAEKVKPGFPITLLEYERHFANAGGQNAIGEASPQYLESPYAAAQIFDYAPHAKIVACFRNPVDRLYSLHQMHSRAGDERRDFETAFNADRDTAPWVSAGFAYANTKRFFDVFDPMQIMTIKFDDFKADPALAMRNMFVFLGVGPEVDIDTGVIHNKGGIPRSAAMFRLSQFATRRPGLRSAVKKVLPGAVTSMWRQMRNANLKTPPAVSADLRRRIAEFFAEDTERTQDLIGLDLSDWLPAS